MTTDRKKMHPLPLACAAAVAAALASPLLAAYEPPLPAYAPPTTYYNAATSTSGPTLLSQLRTIISTGFVSRSYSSVADAIPLLDRDPNNSSNVLLIYNRASVAAPYNNVTWNREHQWPDSRLADGTPNSDMFNLRPSNPAINNDRANQPFGTTTSTGGYADGPVYYFPGDADKGDVARTLFYIATRYTGHTLVNGSTLSGQQMGDLQSLLKYHYTDGVDNFERRRNQYIYGSSGNSTSHDLNPQYYQGNRNPYIDRPEYVWAVFGDGNNNSQIHVGAATPNPDGSSSTTLDLGRVIKGAAIPTGSVTVNKTGANPTTFDVTATGVTTPAASSIPIGTGQPFDYNNVARTMTLALSATSATVGVKTGTVTINNTDLTTSGTGRGSQDADDTITVTATVVDHANASFSLDSDTNSQTIDFGYVPQGFAPRTAPFAIANLPAPSGFTAGLALKSISPNGSPAFSDNVASFTNIPAGTQNTYTATLNPGTTGTLTATRSYSTSDEAIPGAASAGVLNLTLTARVLSSATFPTTGTLQLLTGETYSTGPFSLATGVTLTKTGPGTLHITGPQSNGANSILAITNGITILSTDAGPNLSLSVENPGTTVHLASAQHLASLAINPGASVILADAPLALTSTPASTVRHYLASGLLTSSSSAEALTLGYLVTDASLLVRLTHVGDANLDGTLSQDDYALLDKGFATGGQYWWEGDFNYDGTVDQLDYLAIDLASVDSAHGFSPALLSQRQSQFGATYVSTLLTSIPEPATLILIPAAAAVLLTRRGRRTD